MRILVIGNSGQVARALRDKAASDGLEICAAGRPIVDLAKPDTLVKVVADYEPSVLINAAAYTAVDAAEDDRETAFAANAEGPGAAAAIAAEQHIPFIHISTDYVFDGTKSGRYVESDAPNPLGIYGRSKLAGERAVSGANPKHIILRTEWIHDAKGQNFLRTMLRLARHRSALRVVDDQSGSPTYAPDIAAAILSIAADLTRDDGRWGLYHMTSAGDTTWCGFAKEIFAQSRARGGPSAAVEPIATSEYPTRAARPANSRLDCSKLAKAFGLSLPDWRNGVLRCVDAIAASNWSLE